MPSTSAKQHRFMQAVAHSPSFAKKAGVSQAVGKDFSAADKGKTFNKGGTMKKGKRFSGEDGKSEVTNPYSGPSDLHDYYKTKYAPEAKAEAKAEAKESKPVKEEISEDTRAVTGRADRKYAKNMPSDEKKAESAERIKDMTMAAASLTPIGRLGRVGKAFVPAGRTYRERQNFLREAARDYKLNRDQIARGEAATAGPNLYGRRGITGEEATRAVAERVRSQGYAKGGDIMESKKMMGKEVAFMKKKGAPSSMIKHEEKESKSMKFGRGGGMPPPSGARPDPRMMAAMMAARRPRMGAGMPPSAPPVMPPPPPGGMPPPAQPPMGMKKGGAAKFAKGGGIESRGKTKGTIIRMAAGGSVSSRADGIAQRGKTKFTNY
jgi:hypothetical protein